MITGLAENTENQDFVKSGRHELFCPKKPFLSLWPSFLLDSFDQIAVSSRFDIPWKENILNSTAFRDDFVVMLGIYEYFNYLTYHSHSWYFLQCGESQYAHFILASAPKRVLKALVVYFWVTLTYCKSARPL